MVNYKPTALGLLKISHFDFPKSNHISVTASAGVGDWYLFILTLWLSLDKSMHILMLLEMCHHN